MKTDHTFVGWNTKATGDGTTYITGDEFIAPKEDVTLYAMWKQTTDSSKFTFYYNNSMNPKGWILNTCSSSDDELVIPELYNDNETIRPVVEISAGNSSTGKFPFTITSVVIPDTIEKIGSYAFYKCEELTSVTLGENLETINSNAFKNCTKLESITLPASLTNFNATEFYTPFRNCEMLSAINVAKGNTTYCDVDGVLYSKDKTTLVYYPQNKGDITEFTIPSSVTTIGYNAFEQNKHLVTVTMPDSVTTCNIRAFSYCSALKNVTLSNELTTMHEAMFEYCSALTTVHLPNKLETMERLIFNNCGELTEITIPEGVTSLPQSCFSRCTKLNSITIPSSVTSFGSSCFLNCSALTSFTIPATVTTLESGVFNGCTGLTDFTIPATVTNISDSSNMFNGCTNLTSITIDAELPSLGNSFASNCSSLTSITIPDSVTSLGDSCFSSCRELTSLTIPEAVTSLGTGCFYYTKLTSLYLLRPSSMGITTAATNMLPIPESPDTPTIYVKDEDSKTAYSAAEHWNPYATKIEVGTPE